MAIVDQIAGVLKAGHDEQDLVALPISLLREIDTKLRRGEAAIAQLAGDVRIGAICAEMGR